MSEKSLILSAVFLVVILASQTMAAPPFYKQSLEKRFSFTASSAEITLNRVSRKISLRLE